MLNYTFIRFGVMHSCKSQSSVLITLYLPCPSLSCTKLWQQVPNLAPVFFPGSLLWTFISFPGSENSHVASNHVYSTSWTHHNPTLAAFIQNILHLLRHGAHSTPPEQECPLQLRTSFLHINSRLYLLEHNSNTRLSTPLPLIFRQFSEPFISCSFAWFGIW